MKMKIKINFNNKNKFKPQIEREIGIVGGYIERGRINNERDFRQHSIR